MRLRESRRYWFWTMLGLVSKREREREREGGWEGGGGKSSLMRR